MYEQIDYPCPNWQWTSLLFIVLNQKNCIFNWQYLLLSALRYTRLSTVISPQSDSGFRDIWDQDVGNTELKGPNLAPALLTLHPSPRSLKQHEQCAQNEALGSYVPRQRLVFFGFLECRNVVWYGASWLNHNLGRRLYHMGFFVTLNCTSNHFKPKCHRMQVYYKKIRE